MASRVAGVVPACIAVTEFVAVTCQFIQGTDPRFPLVYFTVWSAILAGAAATASVLGVSAGALAQARIAAAVGVAFSAVVFAAVIAPATATGTWFQPWDDGWVRTATVLLHGVAPVLVVIDVLLRPPHGRLRSWCAAGLVWPLLYLVTVGVTAQLAGFGFPYPFLSPSEMGWRTVAGAVVAMLVLLGVLSAGLHRAAALVTGRTSADR